MPNSAVPSLLSPRPDFPWVSLSVGWEGRLKSRQLTTALAPLTFTPAFPRPVGLNTLEKVLNLPVALAGENSEIIPKGTCLQGLPCCNLSLFQPRQQPGVVLIYPRLCLCLCLCWACAPSASPGDQQNILPLPADVDVGHGARCSLILGTQGKP